MDIALSQPVSYWDGMVLIFMLLVSRYGFWLQTYGDVASRQWVCSVLGFIVASFVLDYDIGYFVSITFITLTLICLVGPRYCHLVGFVMMFGYLSLYRLHYGYKTDIFANYLLASTALNVSGVAFEINKAYKMKQKGVPPPTRPVFRKTMEDDLLKISFLDLFHYTYSYTTIFTGPYVRYQVYADFIQLPYSVIYKRPSLLEDNIIKIIPLLVIPFWIIQNVWSTGYILTPDFTARSILYKLIFSAILCLKFRLLNYIYYCLMLQVNMYAGMGIYEKSCEPVPVYGATKYGDNLPDLAKRRYNNVPTDLEMNFDTIEVTKPFQLEVGLSVSESTGNWNKGLFYWMDEYINKSLLDGIESSKIRMIITCLVCLLWHGVNPGLLFLGAGVLYYYHVESIFSDLLKTLLKQDIVNFKSANGSAHIMGVIYQESKAKVIGFIDVGLYLSKNFIFSCLLMPYFLQNVLEIFSFYKGMNFVPVFFLAVMHFIGSHLQITMGDEKAPLEILNDSETYLTFKF